MKSITKSIAITTGTLLIGATLSAAGLGVLKTGAAEYQAEEFHLTVGKQIQVRAVKRNKAKAIIGDHFLVVSDNPMLCCNRADKECMKAPKLCITGDQGKRVGDAPEKLAKMMPELQTIMQSIVDAAKYE